VQYKETVTQKSSIVCLSKSANKHNRLFVTAEPLDEQLCTAIEETTFKINGDMKERARELVENYSWDPNHARKIWAFGPEETGPNVLVDQTIG